MVDSLSANVTCCRFHVNAFLVTRTTDWRLGMNMLGDLGARRGLTAFFFFSDSSPVLSR